MNCLADHPTDPILHSDLAKAYLKLGDRHSAKKHFIEALQLNPHRIETIQQLALFHRQEGNPIESIRLFKKALRINPLAADTHYQLANTYSLQNQFDLALTHYHEALQYGSSSATHIHRNIGMIYFGENQWERAANHLHQAFSEKPDTQIGLPLGQTLLNLGNPQAAERIYIAVLEQDPNCHDAHHNLGILRLNAQDKIAAQRHFSMAATLKPDNHTAQHMLAALSGKNTVNEPPLEYTRALFDQYAPYYDQHMRTLGYDVPLSIRNLLGELLPVHANNLSVLDLGCGTGFCGVYCRDLAHTLTGVDLSPKMLASAKGLGAYDKLIEASLQSYLETSEDYFDIIIASEVLNYVGNLSELWSKILKVLKPGGYFIFTTESPESSLDTPTKAYSLEQTGRFTHCPKAIQRHIEAYPKLFMQTFTDIMLRKGNNKPVMGRLWCLRHREKDIRVR